MPERIQRKRTKGWKMPANTVSVTRPGHYGNYAAVRAGYTEGERAVWYFRNWLETEASSTFKALAVTELRGKNLACWCALDKPCHADVLLELANSVSDTTLNGEDGWRS